MRFHEDFRAARLPLLVTLALITVLPLAISMPAAAPASERFESAALKDDKVLVRSVTILPINSPVELFEAKTGNGIQPDESKQLADSMRESAAKLFASKGCKLPDDRSTPAALDKDPATKGTVDKIQSEYNAVQQKMFKKPKAVRDGAYTLGGDIASLNPAHDADAFVFLSGLGILSLSDVKAKGVFFGPPYSTKNTLLLQLSVVDANTGVILYFARNDSEGNFLRDPAQVQRTIEESLQDFNCAAPSETK
jgi:hypothetical protein